MMRHNKTTALTLLLGAFLLLPSVALASFPDFGPFETQVRYLEAGFGIAQQFFNQAAGVDGGGALQYLALTAALIGFIMVVLQKKNHALGVLIPWLVIVFIMLAGPYNSKLLFVSAKNNDASVAGGQLSSLVPGGFIAPDQVGFTPQILSIHVMSTLHRLFYDFFSERNIENYIDANIAQAKFNNGTSLTLGDSSYKALKDAEACVQPESPATNAPTNSATSNVAPQTFNTAINDIINQGFRADFNGTVRLPIIALPSTIEEVNGSAATYISNINTIADNVLPSGSFELANLQTPASLTTLVNQIFTDPNSAIVKEYNGSTRASPRHLAYFVAPSANIQNSVAAKSRADGLVLGDAMEMRIMRNSDLFKKLSGTLSETPVSQAGVVGGNAGVSIEERIENQVVTVINNCEDQLTHARKGVIRDALNRGGIDSGLIDLLQDSFENETSLSAEQIQPFTQSSHGPTKLIANRYIKSDLPGHDNNPQVATAALLNQILDNSVRNHQAGLQNTAVTGPNQANAFDSRLANNSNGVTVVNGVSRAFAGLTKPVIQLLSPFILAFSVIVLEMMKVIIDIAITGVIIVTPLAFLMGLIVPGYALGVMILMTLCVLVLKMVPVTFTIVDAIFSIMYNLLEVNQGTFSEKVAQDGFFSAILQAGIGIFLPTFEQTLLLFAAAGVYTSLVGLSLFILFKIGDPSSVSQLAAIDNAAKQTAALAAKVGLVAAGGAAIAAKGAIASGAATKGAQAAGNAAAKDALNNAVGGKNAEEYAQNTLKDWEKDRANKGLAELTQEQRDEFKAERISEYDGLPEMMAEDEETQQKMADAYKTASGGLDMNDPNKGSLKRALLTGGSQAGQMIGGAISSSLPGGGGALMKEISNAGTEGQAQAEARIRAQGQGKSFRQISKEAEIQSYRGQYAGILGQSAAFGGTGEGIAGSGAMSSAMMGHAMEGGKSQAGQEIAGMWAHAEMGHMSAKDYQVAHSLQARQGAANLKAAADGNLLITGDQIKAQAEIGQFQTQASLKEAGEQRDKLNGLIRGQNTLDSLSEQRRNEAVSVDIIEEIDQKTGEITRNYKGGGVGGAEFNATMKEQLESRPAIEESIRQKNQGHKLKLEADAHADAAHVKGQSYDAQVSTVGGVSLTNKEHQEHATRQMKAASATFNQIKEDGVSPTSSAYIEAEQNYQTAKNNFSNIQNARAQAIEPEMSAWKKTNDKFESMIKSNAETHMISAARDHAVRNMVFKDIKNLNEGKQAQFFTKESDLKAMNMGVDMSKTGASALLSSRLAEQRQYRHTAGTQFAASVSASKQFFQADFDGKYEGKVKNGKWQDADLSLARHYEYSMIQDSADGASGIKMDSMVNRKMMDQDWTSFNKAKAINLESQLRGQASLGANMDYGHKLTVTMNDSLVAAERTTDRAQEIQFERQIVGPDQNTGKIMRNGEVIRQRAVQDKYKKLNTEIQKAMGNAGSAIAPFRGKDINGDSYIHDEPPGDLAAEMAKHFQRKGKDLSTSYSTQSGKHAVMVQAANRARNAGLSTDKAIAQLEFTDAKGVSHHYTQVNMDSIRSGLKLNGAQGKKEQQEIDVIFKDLKQNGFKEVDGKFFHKVGVTAKEVMKHHKGGSELVGKNQRELQKISDDAGLDEETMIRAALESKQHKMLYDFKNEENKLKK